MAFGDVLKKFRIREYDDDIYEDEEGDEYDSGSVNSGYSGGSSSSASSSAKTASANKVMSFHEKSTVSLKIHRFKGNQWQETVKKAANDFKNGSAVLLNTEEANKDATTRLLDFLGGVVYALDGKMVRFSTTGYAIVPYDCEITGEIYDDAGYHTDSLFS